MNTTIDPSTMSYMQIAYMYAYKLPIHVAVYGYNQARDMFINDLLNKRIDTSDEEVANCIKNIISHAERKLNDLDETRLMRLPKCKHPMYILMGVMKYIVEECENVEVKRIINEQIEGKDIQMIHI